MPFPIYEDSTFSGQPVQLYEFNLVSDGTNHFWRYNGSDRDLFYAGNLFKQIPISDEGIKLSGEALSTDFQVTLPITEDFCSTFRNEGTVPSDTVFLRVRRVHAADISDIDSAVPTVTDGRLVWVGTVNGITQLDDIRARVTCAMLAASFRRGGLRYGYQRNCPHVLYAPLTCKKNRNDFKITGSVSAISGNQVQSAVFGTVPDGWLSGGFIEYDLASGIVERRMILSHAGTTVILLGFAPELVAGSLVSAFAGCDRTVDTCVNKFDNLANMGGFPHTPGRNPFDGQPVF